MIEVNNLTRYYGSFTALQDVSFTLAEGEIVGLLGLNGAGKSTTLKILAGLMIPSEGSVRFDGVDVTGAPDQVAAKIGYLPEEPPLYRDMTVTAFLLHVARLKGMSTADARKRLPMVVDIAQLQGREDQLISELSHGYRKRVGIAQAVIHDPKLVILDEPISGLDPKQIVGMRQVIRKLAEGRAVIVSSHILGEISQTCDRILVIKDGKLVAEGTEDELAAGRAGDRKLVITVRGDRDAFLAALGNHAMVAKAEAHHPHDAALAGALVLLHEDTREQLVADLVQQGFGIRLIEAPEDELEEIFLGLTEAA